MDTNELLAQIAENTKHLQDISTTHEEMSNQLDNLARLVHNLTQEIKELKEMNKGTYEHTKSLDYKMDGLVG